MRGFGRSAALSFITAASLVFVLGGCAAPESVSRDIHVKRGVTLEDDLIHFYGAPSQRIIRGDSEYFVYNARVMNITSADGTACRGTPVFIFSYETKRLSDLKCRENIPAEEFSNKAGDSIVVGVTDSGNAPMYDASSPETNASEGGDMPLAPAAGITRAEPLPADGSSVPVEDLGESSGTGEQDTAGSAAYGTQSGAADGVPEAGSAGGSGSSVDSTEGAAGSEGSGSAQGSGDEIPLAGEDVEMEIINR